LIKERNILDQETPLKDMIGNKNLKVIEMELSRKPSLYDAEESKMSDIPRSSSVGGYDVTSRRCFLNFKEFALTKITKSGKVNKILGMDQNKIYELSKSKLTGILDHEKLSK
jgi:hypothetical protein